MAGTVKPYSRHVFVCTETADWPREANDHHPFLTELSQRLQSAPETRDTRLTACHHPLFRPAASMPGTFDLLLFPDAMRIRVVGLRDLDHLQRYLRSSSAARALPTAGQSTPTTAVSPDEYART